MVGGTGIEPCPLQEKCSTFKELMQQKIPVHNSFIKISSRKIEIGEGWEKNGDE
jgi:hypothetical protein